MFLTPDKLSFIAASEMTEGMQLWSGIPQQTLFESYVVESQNANQVALEVVVENLERALKSAQLSTDCLCKLTKKNGAAYLTFIVELKASQVMNVVHDVPIRLQTPTQINMLVEPVLPDPTVHILMPPLKQIKPVVERLKRLDEVLVIECNMDGCLKLGVQTDSAKITTVVRGLEHPKVEGAEEAPARDPDKWGTARVDMKKFVRFLGAHHVGHAAVVCCIIKGKAVVMHVILEGTFYLTYYIPIVQ